MTKRTKRPNRCKMCNKIITEKNKSGYCSWCYKKQYKRKND